MISSSQAFWGGAFVFLAGALLGGLFFRWKQRKLHASRVAEEKSLQEKVRREAEATLREARLAANEEALKLREQTEKSFGTRRRELSDLEQRLAERESLINRQLEGVVQRENDLRNRQETLEGKEAALGAEREELGWLLRLRKEQLLKLSQLSETEARALLLKEVEQEALQDATDLTRHILDDARLKAIDDTPNAVVLSGFDPVRREIAREAMQRLILDGRIHPTRIEEVVARVSEEMDESILRAGEEAVMKVGLPSLHVEIIKLLGRLRFRYSFSQNILDHSIEVAHLMGLMAAELNLDPAMAKRAGLLHDIGKAINHEVEGAHAIIGADFIKRYGECDDVVNGVASHHDEVPHTNVLGILVSAADAISASRPGARSETLTTYIKRLENLEKLGRSFPGVDRCFAVQAGRELRVMVQPDQINDEDAFVLARNIARKIEEELHYPGQIRVTVIRETRCVEFAK